jgi:hypothetical protein
MSSRQQSALIYGHGTDATPSAVVVHATEHYSTAGRQPRWRNVRQDGLGQCPRNTEVAPIIVM